MHDIWAIPLSILFVGLGILIVAFAIRYAKIEKSPVLVALLIIPIVIYLILTGRLGEFKAPGGLEAKFVLAAQQPVKITTQTAEEAMQAVQVTARGGIGELNSKVRALNPAVPVILTVELGKSYKREDWVAYLNEILNRAPIAYVALVDNANHLIAHMSVPTVKEILKDFNLGGELIRLIAESAADKIIKIPGVETAMVSMKGPAIEILQMMEQTDTSSLIAVDAHGRIAGILRKEDVTAQIILNMYSGKRGAETDTPPKSTL